MSFETFSQEELSPHEMAKQKIERMEN